MIFDNIIYVWYRQSRTLGKKSWSIVTFKVESCTYNFSCRGVSKYSTILHTVAPLQPTRCTLLCPTVGEKAFLWHMLPWMLSYYLEKDQIWVSLCSLISNNQSLIEFEFEWGFYAQSASEASEASEASAIFRARAYTIVPNLFCPVMMMITRWMKLGGNQPPGDNPLLFSKSGRGYFICPVAYIDTHQSHHVMLTVGLLLYI